MDQDCKWINSKALCEVQIDSFYIVVEGLLIWYFPVALSIPCIFEDDSINADLFE